MLKTGKSLSEGQAFHRRLLSEYNTDITLDNYVSYFSLKPIAKEIESLRNEIEARVKDVQGKATPGETGAPELVDPILNGLRERRERLQKDFFDELRVSYERVKNYLIRLEGEMQASMQQLRRQTNREIQEMEEDYIPFIYMKLECILTYRSLNLLALRKIMKKFLERCACDSLELQRRILKVDGLIHRSNIAQPSLNLRGIALELLAMFGTVYKYTYEEATEKLRAYAHRTGTNVQRILPNSSTFYFTSVFPHHERPGSFSVRVLAGSGSLFGEKMVTEVLQCPRYPGITCGRFANGEINVTLNGPVRGDDVFILQSMTASEDNNLSNSASVMELALMIHAAQLAAAARITTVVPYLAYTRNVASISAIAEIIETMGCHHIITVDMHSDQVEGMFSIPMESISAKYEFVRYLSNQLEKEGHDFTNITIVAPAGGFLGRAKDFADALMSYGHLDSERQFVSVCTAVKRVRSGPLAPARLPLAICTTSLPIHGTSPSADCATTPPGSERGTNTPVGEASSTFTTPWYRDLTNFPQEGGVASRSPTIPTIADMPPQELRAALEGMSKVPADHPEAARGTSTLGIEVALRKQEEGRRGVVTHHIERRRNEFEDIALVGDVQGRLCVIVDTVIDEAVNICQVAKSLKSNGAVGILLVATHAIMSGLARERLIEAPIDRIIVTDSVNQDSAMMDPRLAKKLRIVPISPLLARAIEKIHTENTLPTSFEK